MEVRTTQTDTQILYFLFIFSPCKNCHVTYLDDDNKPFKIICQRCNRFVRCAGKSGELLYINFIHEVMPTLELYPEGISQEILFFQ